MVAPEHVRIFVRHRGLPSYPRRSLLTGAVLRPVCTLRMALTTKNRKHWWQNQRQKLTAARSAAASRAMLARSALRSCPSDAAVGAVREEPWTWDRPQRLGPCCGATASPLG